MRLALGLVGLVLLAGATLIAATSSHAQSDHPGCPLEAPCPLGDSHYVALPPPDWDGRQPLKLAVFLHGYHQPASEVLADPKLAPAVNERGLLFVIPDTPGDDWSVPGAPQHDRDDIGYLKRVIADVHRRFPVDDRDMTGIGFSLGASFLWNVACQDPTMFKHYIAFSGAFWRPHPEQCAPGPVDLIHIHGTTDQTVPMHGRALRGGAYRQGDAIEGIAFWRRTKQCEASPVHSVAGDLSCETTNECIGHSSIRMCLHDGGHWVNPTWLGWALDQQQATAGH